jgi:hypothetical protein
MSLLAAAGMSFVFLNLAPRIAIPALAQIATAGGDTGPLGLLGSLYNPFLEALAGSGVLTIISLVIHMVQLRREFPNWLPYLCSFPVAAVLILPSALEHGGPWQAWLIFIAMVAGCFCFHWRSFTWARGIWD